MCAITFCCPIFCVCSLCAGGSIGSISQCCCQSKVNRVGQAIVPVHGPDGAISYETRSYTYEESTPLPLTFCWIGSSLASLIVGIILYVELARKCGEDYEYDTYYWDSSTNSSVYNGTISVEGPGFSLNPLHTEGERCWSEGNAAYFGLGFITSILLAVGASFLLVSWAFYHIYGRRGCCHPLPLTNEISSNGVSNIPSTIVESQGFMQNNQMLPTQNIVHASNTQSNTLVNPSMNGELELPTRSPSSRQSPVIMNGLSYNQLPNAMPTNSYSYSYPSESQPPTVELNDLDGNTDTSETAVLNYKKDAEINI